MADSSTDGRELVSEERPDDKLIDKDGLFFY